ncbi:MAG: hypothetical protein RLZ98_327 [Pseudomonadota bacterium]|jgi:3-oxoacyl-[acyl-carrier-protein] synthase-3
MTSSRIAGLGHYAPDTIVGNDEIERRLGLSAGWIERRTGIRSRRFASGEQAVTDLAHEAACNALADAGIGARDIGLLLLATSTPDHLLPPSAPLLAHRLGLSHAGAMDLAGACTGFVQAFALADAYVCTHRRNVLVVAANILSRRINPDDAVSSVLFGDGAGAAVLVPTDEAPCGVLGHYLGSRGAYYDLIKIEAGGSRSPFAADTVPAQTKIEIRNNRLAYMRAIESMAETSRAALMLAGLEAGDIDWWVPHQANLRLIEAARGRIGIPPERTLLSVVDFANSSAATIPLTLSLNRAQFAAGQTVLMTAVGAGFTEGAIVYRL